MKAFFLLLVFVIFLFSNASAVCNKGEICTVTIHQSRIESYDVENLKKFDFVATNANGLGFNEPSYPKMFNVVDSSVPIVLYDFFVEKATFDFPPFYDWALLNPHNDWFLLDLQGNRINHPTSLYPYLYEMDVRNAAYQDYVAQRSKDLLDVHVPALDGNVQGLFFDQTFSYEQWTKSSVGSDASCWPNNCPTMTQTEYENAVITILQKIRQKIGSRLLTINGSYTGYTQFVDSQLWEGWMHAWWKPSDQHYTESEMLAQINYLADPIFANKSVFVGAGNPVTSQKMLDFAFSAYLIAKRNDSYAYFYYDDRQSLVHDDYFIQLYETILGTALTDYYIDAQNNVLVREFQRGKVLLNLKNTASPVIHFDRDYITLQGSRINSILLEDYSGIILMNAETNPPTVSITSPTNNSTITGALNITADASDDYGVSRVEFYLDGSLIGIDLASPYTNAFNSINPTNGTHIVTAKAIDAANKSGTSTITIIKASELSVENNITTFLVHYNSGTNADFALGSPIPGISNGTLIENGLISKGMIVDSSDSLTYRTSSNFNKPKGTIEFWLKPQWNGSDIATRSFFVAWFDSSNYFKIDTRIISNTKSIAFWTQSSGIQKGLIYAPITLWNANEWHHIAVTWGPIGRKLYLDGVLKSSDSYTGEALQTVLPVTFSVGAKQDATEQANSVIDELRLSNNQKTDQEILNDYLLASSNALAHCVYENQIITPINSCVSQNTLPFYCSSSASISQRCDICSGCTGEFYCNGTVCTRRIPKLPVTPAGGASSAELSTQTTQSIGVIIIIAIFGILLLLEKRLKQKQD